MNGAAYEKDYEYVSFLPCTVDGIPAKFIGWDDVPEYIPTPALGNYNTPAVHQLSQFRQVMRYRSFGIVEYKNGSVARVKPERIVFVTESADNSEEKDNSPPEIKSRSGMQCKETKIKCPHCKEENKNAVLWCDATAREYFVYCQKCGIETIDVFPTAARAIKAFSDGKNKNIIEKYH